MIKILREEAISNLYHCTYLDNACSILRDGIIKTSYGELSGDTVDNAVCVTTDPNYSIAREESPIKFVLNSSILNDLESSPYKDYNAGCSESEIRIYSDIQLSKYLVEIDLSSIGKDPVDYYFNLIKNNIGEFCCEYEDINYWVKFFKLAKNYKISKNLKNLRSRMVEII